MNPILEAIKTLSGFAQSLKEKNDPKAQAVTSALEALLKALQGSAQAPAAPQAPAPQAAPAPQGMPQRAPYNAGSPNPVSRVM